MKENENFGKKVLQAASHPAIQIYAIFIVWLLVRTAPVFLSESWWGTWFRFDGILFEVSFLTGIVVLIAWMSEFEFTAIQKKLVAFLGAILVFSIVIFPALSLDRYIGVLPVGRFMGSVGNPLFLAGLLLFVPWFADRFKNRAITMSASIVALGFLVATDTRGAFIAALAGVVVYFWESKNVSLRLRIGVVSVIMAVGIFGMIAVGTGKISLIRSVTISTRLAMWKSGLHELSSQQLIGFGVGNHRDNIDRSSAQLSELSYGEISDSTHSAYLDIALKGGLVALVIFFVWIVVVYRSIVGVDQRLSRATFAAYLVLIATAPWMVWTTIPLMYVLACHLEQKKIALENRYVYAGIGGVVIICAGATLLVTAINATYLSTVSEALNTRQFVLLPKNRMITNKFLPFTKDFEIELLRISMPTDTISSAPSAAGFIENIVRPAMLDVEPKLLHPDALNVAATWASTYASSGLTSTHGAWFERSLSFQRRALEINPERPAAVFQSADSLRELGRIQEAIVVLKTFADQHPLLPEARFYQALMIDISGDTQGAFKIEQQLKNDFPYYSWKESIQGWFIDIEARAQKL